MMKITPSLYQVPCRSGDHHDHSHDNSDVCSRRASGQHIHIHSTGYCSSQVLRNVFGAAISRGLGAMVVALREKAGWAIGVRLASSWMLPHIY